MGRFKSLSGKSGAGPAKKCWKTSRVYINQASRSVKVRQGLRTACGSLLSDIAKANGRVILLAYWVAMNYGFLFVTIAMYMGESAGSIASTYRYNRTRPD